MSDDTMKLLNAINDFICIIFQTLVDIGNNKQVQSERGFFVKRDVAQQNVLINQKENQMFLIDQKRFKKKIVID